MSIFGMGAGGYIDGWAYESTPGLEIFAGQVPEPGSRLLAVGTALAWMSVRRRHGAAESVRRRSMDKPM